MLSNVSFYPLALPLAVWINRGGEAGGGEGGIFRRTLMLAPFSSTWELERDVM